jgi:putative transposase
MPTHFHFLIQVKEISEGPKMSDTFKVSDISLSITKQIRLFLSSYTKAINKRYKRHGSLFQPHSKAKEIHEEKHLLTLVSYIHQNPVRSTLVAKPGDWKFSSYQDLIGIRDGSLPDRDFVRRYFRTDREFREYSEEIVSSIKEKYWV